MYIFFDLWKCAVVILCLGLPSRSLFLRLVNIMGKPLTTFMDGGSSGPCTGEHHQGFMLPTDEDDMLPDLENGG